MQEHQWKNKISHHAQLGGIETSVLDNGAGRGVRIAWINTGTGLRYKLVLDRGMDIADAFYNEQSLAWIGYAGVVAPASLPGKGLDWLAGFGGGLLTTCGLDHVGGPESDAFGERGLHSRISHIPAEIIAVTQPDPLRGKMDMSITGIMKHTQALGPSLELKRTISGSLGKAQLTISDEITNMGNENAPHMLLYHFNFGWPLVDEGTEINWKGKWRSRESPDKRKIFVEGNDFHHCLPVLDEHSGRGEEAVFVDIEEDESGYCYAALKNNKTGLEMRLSFLKKELPWFTNWQHFAKNEYVTGIEPGTHPPVGQAAARADNTLIFLEPGETRKYHLTLEIIDHLKK